jgi:hypothetical protein
MSWRRPPILATWLLQHLSDRYRRDELAGDLIEEYQLGRSYGWYWRQTLSALFAAGVNSVRRNLPVLRAHMIWWGALLIVGITFKQPVVLLFALDPSFGWIYAKARKRQARLSRPDT